MTTQPATAPRLVFVSGPPGSGKTTLAGPLAAELGFGLLAKDRIKESLHDALGLDADLAWSRRLGVATMELMWALAADSPAVVLEANFWPDDPRHGQRVRALGARTVEVHCSCPIEECRRRYAARAASRHPVHVLDRESGLAAGAASSGGSSAAPAAAVLAEGPSADTFARSARPLRLGPVLTVDTTGPVDVAALAADVRQLLAG
ncbi:MAG: AAA family ATPase [Streptosporangiaceae bacterium]